MSFFRLPEFSQSETARVYYNKASRPARVDNCEETRKIIELIEKIRQRAAILKKDWETGGAGTNKAYPKHHAMDMLLTAMDEKITNFNAGLQKPDANDENEEIKVLVQELKGLVDLLLTNPDQLEVILAKRNNDKATALTATTVGLPVGAFVWAATGSYLTFGGSLLCAAALGAGAMVSKYYKLNNPDTESHILLTDLNTELEEVANKLTKGSSVRP